jgi:quinol-cytochrome oxidoreductase complex cytochrome b subunit
MNAFEHVLSIHNDVFFGFHLRILHGLCANLFFLFILLHILKAYFFTSSKNTFVVLSGILIFFLLCAIAFLGYVLPFGQMSF